MAKKTERVSKEIPQYKLDIVKDLVKCIKNNRTMLIASTKNLPGSQFHKIKKNLRGSAEIKFSKKSAITRAIEDSKNPALLPVEEYIKSDVVIFFSNLEPFELSSLLSDNQSASRAKGGDIAPEDISIEPGPTDLIPGPAISELSGVGLKVAVEGGKLAIKQGAVVAKKGDKIKDNVAAVLSKLNIFPMKVGFEPIAAFDSKANKVYTGIRIDKKSALESLRESIAKALGFATSVKYLTKETLTYFLAKAAAEEKAITLLMEKKSNIPAQETNQPQGGSQS